VPNLESFFAQCRQELAQFDRTSPEYLPTLSKISNQIRDKILKYVMVRRTRSQIKRHYADDMEKQGLIFPELANPHRLIYRFDSHISPIFDETLDKLKNFCYARYTPLLYLKMGISGQLKQGQNNIGAFMRMMLVKRLESSFYAFRSTLARFIHSYERFIGMVDAGTVWIGSSKVLDLFESDDDGALQKMVDEGELESYQTVQFVDGFRDALQADLNLLYAIFALWNGVSDDPKRDKLIEALREDTVLSQEKVIIFSESAETHTIFSINSMPIFLMRSSLLPVPELKSKDRSLIARLVNNSFSIISIPKHTTRPMIFAFSSRLMCWPKGSTFIAPLSSSIMICLGIRLVFCNELGVSIVSAPNIH
jgi:hypothetical protein